MKKFYIIAMGLVGMVLASSCSDEAKKESEPAQQPIQLSFKGIISDGDADTRTYLTGSQVYWNTDDAINVFSGTSSYRFDTKEGEAARVTFVGTVLSEDNTYYALYPYNEDATLSIVGTTLTYSTISLPDEQVAVANSFARDCNFTVAKTTSSEMAFSFKNVCGLVKFNFSGSGDTPFTKAKLEENIASGKAYISGPMTITYNPNIAVSSTSPYNPSVSITGAGVEDFITLKAPAGTTFAKGTDYYFVVPPTVFANGYKITFSDETGGISQVWAVTTSESAENLRTINRSKIRAAGSYSEINVVNLAEKTEDYTANTGEILTGTLGSSYKLTIADGATVVLRDVTIGYTGANPAITCSGAATIILVGTNTITASGASQPGISVSTSLTVSGTGAMTVTGGSGAAGINGNVTLASGNLTAIGGNAAASSDGNGGAGISGYVTANGGVLTASGGAMDGSGVDGKGINGTVTLGTGIKMYQNETGDFSTLPDPVDACILRYVLIQKKP